MQLDLLEQLDFEDDTDESVQDMLRVFAAWLLAQQKAGVVTQPSTAIAYTGRWNAFTAWCAKQVPRVRLRDLTESDLLAFQNELTGKPQKAEDRLVASDELAQMKVPNDLPASPRHTLRTLNLIDHVLGYYAHINGQEKNEAAYNCIQSQEDVRYADARPNKGVIPYLETHDARALVSFLSQSRPRPGAPAVNQDWQDLRNAAAMSLQLGAGITPGEVRALTLASVVIEGGRVRGRPWKLIIPQIGASPSRETPIAHWAGEVLRHWLLVRKEQGIGLDALFPSVRSGKPWSKRNHHLAVVRVFEQAKLTHLTDGGSFRLRHTFALRQLKQGYSEEQVAGMLGIEPEAMGRYRAIVIAPVSVV
ncbi:tyrosine-type recombinase/integrase [Variovorax sp. LT1P1]|uniref:tyrosine-type recombinase/integrase n=1 Tax=Variovorax sp. LT1P1 TaxID=3443730 RepID=UPI003F46DFDF